MTHLLNVGFGSYVPVQKVVAIMNPDSSPCRKLRDEAKKFGRLLDSTLGRKVRAMVVLDSAHVLLSALQHETLATRLEQVIAAQNSEKAALFDAAIKSTPESNVYKSGVQNTQDLWKELNPVESVQKTAKINTKINTESKPA